MCGSHEGEESEGQGDTDDGGGVKRHRSDLNQKDIVKALQAIGAFVVNLNQVGDGCPDLAVYYHGWHLIEVKSDSPIGWKYKPAQKEFNKRCPVSIPVLTNFEDVEKWARAQLLNVEHVERKTA